jgi:phenylalanine-4-hydroxylase
MKPYDSLSIVKEAEGTPQATDAAEKAVEDLQNNMGELSEMAQMQPTLVDCRIWLDRNSRNPKFYGLLSSIGESAYCMTDQVKKILMISAAYQSFDITKLQPQLYVTPYVCLFKFGFRGVC